MSFRGEDGELVFWDKEKDARTPLYDRFIAGVLATAADFTLFFAPNINSYKRFADGSFAPTTLGWGLDNRTCAMRLVGRGAGARMENRIPGADANPYLALAAMIAGGLHGIDEELELEPELTGNAYASDKPRVPSTMGAARERFHTSTVVRAALGDEVVEHYANMADIELAAYNATVTDWELVRGFERL
jgi:glutamine synthetase